MDGPRVSRKVEVGVMTGISERPGDPGFPRELDRLYRIALFKRARHDLVSVIIPVKDCEKYLAQCLAGVTTQSYPFLEIIVVDDGSSDRTAAIAEGFAAGDPRVRLIRNPEPSGPGAARNLALDACHGRWLQFTDGDDIPGRNLIGGLLAAADRLPRSRIPVAAYRKFRSGNPAGLDLSEGTGKVLRDAKMPRALHRMLFDREPILSEGLRFERLGYGEDTLFIFDYLDRGEMYADPILVELPYFYRLSPGSLTRGDGKTERAREAYWAAVRRRDSRQGMAEDGPMRYLDGLIDICRRVGKVGQ